MTVLSARIQHSPARAETVKSFVTLPTRDAAGAKKQLPGSAFSNVGHCLRLLAPSGSIAGRVRT